MTTFQAEARRAVVATPPGLPSANSHFTVSPVPTPHWLKRAGLCAAMCLGLVATVRAEETAPQATGIANPPAATASVIQDDAGMFSREALSTANETLLRLSQRSGREIHIHTIASVPADRVAAVQAMSKSERSKYFETLAKDLATKSKAHGLFVFICQSPGHVRVLASPKLQNQGFKPQTAQRISDAFLQEFSGKADDRFDRGLAAGVTKIEAAFGQLLGTAAAVAKQPNLNLGQPFQNAGADWAGWLLTIALMVGGLFVVSAIIRALFGAVAGGGVGGPAMGYGGGGGFFGSFLTGMFGAMAGHYLYDSFFGHSAHAGDPTHSSFGQDATGGNVSDSVSDGNSWGGDFGGGDSGGGDFGGGDFGGGDF